MAGRAGHRRLLRVVGLWTGRAGDDADDGIVRAVEPVALFRSQGGVASRTQLRSAGVSAYRIRRMVASGQWAQLYGARVLAVAGSPLTAGVRDRAAALACGPDASLAGPSAARLLGMAASWPQPVVAVRRTSRREPAGITVLREDPPDHDLVLLDGLLVTCRSRSVVDCLRLLPDEAGRTLLDRALQQGWITFDDLVRRTQELTGRAGVPRLRRHIRVASWGTRSEAERLLRRLLRRARIRGWQADYPLSGVGVVDVAFPALRLAIEVDGRAWHVAGDRFQLDRSRQNALVAHGWTVLRFTWEDLVRRPTDVVAAISLTMSRLAA